MESDEIHEETGPEWMAAVVASAPDLKLKLCELEDQEPLGRLWDLDVIVADGPLSRSVFGIPPRKCLICDEEAHTCARSRAHSMAELEDAIVSMMVQ